MFWGLIVSTPVIIVLSMGYGADGQILTASIWEILVGPLYILLDVFTEREFMLRETRSGGDSQGINNHHVVLTHQALGKINVINSSTLNTYFTTLRQGLPYLLKSLPIIR